MQGDSFPTATALRTLNPCLVRRHMQCALTMLAILVGGTKALSQTCGPTWIPAGPSMTTDGQEVSLLCNYMASWDPDGSGPMASVAVAAGYWSRIDGTSGGVATWNGAYWTCLPGQVLRHTGGTPAFSEVFLDSAAVYDGQIVVGGAFSLVGGTFAGGVARWTGTQWEALRNGGGWVRELATAGGKLFGIDYDGRLWRYDGSTLQYLDPATTGIGSGTPIRMFGNDEVLLVATTSSVVHRYSNGTWQAMPGLAVNGSLGAVTQFGSETVACGDFVLLGGATVARWDGSAWQPMGTNASTFGRTIETLTVFNGRLYAGVVNPNVGGTQIPPLFVWTGTDWSAVGDLAVQPRSGPAIVNGTELLVGTSGRLTDTNSPWIAQSPPSEVVADCGQTVTLAVTPASGYENLQYQWKRNGVSLVDGVQPTLSNINGSTTATLVIAAPNKGDRGLYHCVVSNTCGVAASTPTVVTFSGPTCCGADVDDGTGGGTPDGSVDINDLLYFLQQFEAGC